MVRSRYEDEILNMPNDKKHLTIITRTTTAIAITLKKHHFSHHPVISEDTGLVVYGIISNKSTKIFYIEKHSLYLNSTNKTK